jgi:predicted DNA-binding antitoxin AbrB/MazE fold protein
MRPVEALYEDGLLRPAKPLNLRQGERVALIVVRRSDPSRWDLARLSAHAAEDVELASSGLDCFAEMADREDNG